MRSLRDGGGFSLFVYVNTINYNSTYGGDRTFTLQELSFPGVRSGEGLRREFSTVPIDRSPCGHAGVLYGSWLQISLACFSIMCTMSGFL